MAHVFHRLLKTVFLPLPMSSRVIEPVGTLAAWPFMVREGDVPIWSPESFYQSLVLVVRDPLFLLCEGLDGLVCKCQGRDVFALTVHAMKNTPPGQELVTDHPEKGPGGCWRSVSGHGAERPAWVWCAAEQRCTAVQSTRTGPPVCRTPQARFFGIT